MQRPAADLGDRAFRERLERASLAPYVQRQRWFGGKARAITTARFVDWAALPSTPHPSWLAIAEVMYVDGGTERYHMPLVAFDSGAADTVRHARPDAVLGADDRDGSILCDGVLDDAVCVALLVAIQRGTMLRGTRGTMHARPVTTAEADTDAMAVTRLPGVHSNSAIAIGGRYLLKLFRRIEPGINPDVEIGRFLARSGARVPVPALFGTIDYADEHGSEATLALVQQLVAARGNAWDLTLAQLASFFAGARSHGEPPTPAATADLARASVESLALLGERTGELHAVLASATTDPDFVPGRTSQDDITALVERIHMQAAAALDRLAARCAALDINSRGLATRVIAQRETIFSRIRRLGRELEPFVTIRIHGDYHLGQVLCVGRDFVIIDFEGEPTRSVAERRARQSPLRDVAGMRRSIAYAARAGLITAAGSNDAAALAAWARAWETATADALLRGYLSVAGGLPFVPDDMTHFRITLELFVLEKALYELDYEMNNRPDWVATPLAGILSLLDDAAL